MAYTNRTARERGFVSCTTCGLEDEEEHVRDYLDERDDALRPWSLRPRTRVCLTPGRTRKWRSWRRRQPAYAGEAAGGLRARRPRRGAGTGRVAEDAADQTMMNGRHNVLRAGPRSPNRHESGIHRSRTKRELPLWPPETFAAPSRSSLFLMPSVPGCGGGERRWRMRDAADLRRRSPPVSHGRHAVRRTASPTSREAQEIPVHGARLRLTVPEDAPNRRSSSSAITAAASAGASTPRPSPRSCRDYIETGRVHWKYITYVSGMFAERHCRRPIVAECAGAQGLFADPINRPPLRAPGGLEEPESDPTPVFQELAREVGADMSTNSTPASTRSGRRRGCGAGS